MTYISRLRSRGVFLYEVYPYAAWLGKELKVARPDWFASFSLGRELTAMDQANNFAFIAFCEHHFVEEVDYYLEVIINQGPDYLSRELANTFDWFYSEESH